MVYFWYVGGVCENYFCCCRYEECWDVWAFQHLCDSIETGEEGCYRSAIASSLGACFYWLAKLVLLLLLSSVAFFELRRVLVAHWFGLSGDVLFFGTRFHWVLMLCRSRWWSVVWCRRCDVESPGRDAIGSATCGRGDGKCYAGYSKRLAFAFSL